MEATNLSLQQSLFDFQTGAPAGPGRGLSMEKAREAAQEFEAVFLAQMVSHMFAGIKTDKNFGGGSSEDIYRSMMAQEYGKTLAKAGGIGIADQVMREIIRIQEAQAQ
ncbi:MAG: rod-binding protein [Alphaproteobacteria bacterium]|nr:rod-binding protein [Alphaproteobacteria bacterium]